ncbi:MAG: hypothetical protein ACOX2G_03010 [Bacillota bacterium]|jgi:hypothetical protein
MQVLGIAGTAKNTGKTTTTVAIINQWPRHQHLAVTSIGYDGESKDNVTGLPKPRLNVPAGALVVTAEGCLEAGSARLETIEKTDLTTPLGRLVICRVRSSGLVVLAGPNSQSALRFIIDRLREQEIELLLVDGALGRLAPMAAADGLVLATGAARTRDLDRLAQETAALSALFSLEMAEDLIEPILQLGSMLVEEQGRHGALAAAGYRTVEFSGVVDLAPLKLFIGEIGDALPDLILRDPVKLMLSQDLVETAKLLAAYRERGGRVLVRNTLPLKVITVNPFYPDFDAVSFKYAPGMLDALELYSAIAGTVSVPVVDVVRQGGAELARILGMK